jgi:hypothetical protein
MFELETYFTTGIVNHDLRQYEKCVNFVNLYDLFYFEKSK